MGNKEGAGTEPRASWQLSLLGGLATGGARLFRRRLFRRRGLTRRLLLRCCLLLRYCHSASLLRAGWLSVHSSYSARRTTRIAFETRAVTYEGKATGILHALPFLALNVQLATSFVAPSLESPPNRPWVNSADYSNTIL